MAVVVNVSFVVVVVSAVVMLVSYVVVVVSVVAAVVFGQVVDCIRRECDYFWFSCGCLLLRYLLLV